jgi:hypothetical protein
MSEISFRSHYVVILGSDLDLFSLSLAWSAKNALVNMGIGVNFSKCPKQLKWLKDSRRHNRFIITESFQKVYVIILTSFTNICVSCNRNMQQKTLKRTIFCQRLK